MTGVAGLLFSFDPRLTPAEVKGLILEGARRGGRTMPNRDGDPIPMLNAYESLKAAAERPDAPLCGNPVYQDAQGNVFTRRGERWESELPSLFSSSGSALLAPLHGGKRVRFDSGAGYEWQGSGAWTALGAISDTLGSAANRSRRGQSHGGDTTVTVARRPGPNPRYDEVWDVFLNGTLLTTLDHTRAPKVDAGYAVNRCVKWETWGNEYSACRESFAVKSQILMSHTVAYSSGRSEGGEVVLAIALENVQSTIDEAPYYYAGYFQRNHRSEWQTAGTHLFFIDVKTKAVRTEFVRLFDVKDLAIAEDGQHMAMRQNLRLLTFSYTALGTQTTRINNCDVLYQRIELQGGFTRLFSLPTVVGRPTCYPEATFAA